MSRMIDVDQWLVVHQLNYKGIVYSQGEPLPKMPEAEALRLREEGVLVRRGERPVDVQVERLLVIADDAALLRELRPPVGRSWPEAALLRALLERARLARRSEVLIEAIRFSLREPRGDK